VHNEPGLVDSSGHRLAELASALSFAVPQSRENSMSYEAHVLATSVRARPMNPIPTQELWEAVVRGSCTFCGVTRADATMTPDRLCSDLGYDAANNVVSCCLLCNVMKAADDAGVFLARCRAVAIQCIDVVRAPGACDQARRAISRARTKRLTYLHQLFRSEGIPTHTTLHSNVRNGGLVGGSVAAAKTVHFGSITDTVIVTKGRKASTYHSTTACNVLRYKSHVHEMHWRQLDVKFQPCQFCRFGGDLLKLERHEEIATMLLRKNSGAIASRVCALVHAGMGQAAADAFLRQLPRVALD
jgi:hypothetical protein